MRQIAPKERKFRGSSVGTPTRSTACTMYQMKRQAKSVAESLRANAPRKDCKVHLHLDKRSGKEVWAVYTWGF